MSRNTHSGRQSRRSTKRVRHFEREESVVTHSLDKVGLSVFRSVGDVSLDGCCEVFANFTIEASAMRRGEADQHGLALNLVSLAEVRLRSFERDVDTQDVINEIYNDVLSLRRPLSIGLQKVGLFGSRDSKLRSVGVAIHEDERSRVYEERDAIIEILNGHATTPLTREDWWTNDIPHISLGKIVMDGMPDHQRRVMLGSMNDAVPQENITLERATLHNPSR